MLLAPPAFRIDYYPPRPEKSFEVSRFRVKEAALDHVYGCLSRAIPEFSAFIYKFYITFVDHGLPVV